MTRNLNIEEDDDDEYEDMDEDDDEYTDIEDEEDDGEYDDEELLQVAGLI